MTSITSPFEDIFIENYSDRSIVMKGDTRKYKEDLKLLGGKYNGRLRDGPGWIFSKKVEDQVNAFINNGKRLVSKDEQSQGEERTRNWKVDLRSKKKKEFLSEKKENYLFISMLDKLDLVLKKISKLEISIKNIEEKLCKNDDSEEIEYSEEEEGEIVEDSDEETEDEVPMKRLLR